MDKNLLKAIRNFLNRFKKQKEITTALPACIDEKDESNNVWLGRTYGDAPDVDSTVIIQGNNIKSGDIKSMVITGNVGYDLTATSKTGKRTI